MLYACGIRFDVVGNLKNFIKFFGTKALFSSQNFSRFPVTSNLAAHA